MGRSNAPRATAIAAFSVAIATAIAVIGGYPLAKRAWADREAQTLRERYATGLSPCEAGEIEVLDHVDAMVRQDLPAAPDVSITVFGAFTDPKGVRIAGTTLVSFRVSPAKDSDGKPVPTSDDWGEINIERRASLKASTVRSIRETLADDIAHASAERRLGFDGTVYYFRTLEGGCATTWSPDPTTRASMWAALFHALSRQVPATEAQAYESGISRHLDALSAE